MTALRGASRCAWVFGAALGFAACSTPPSGVTPAPAPFVSAAIAPAASGSAELVRQTDAGPEAVAAKAEDRADRVTGDEAEEALFLGAADKEERLVACRRERDDDARIRCTLAARYAGDPAAAASALSLFARAGSIAGVLPEEDMDGGFRGEIHLVPELPIGPERRHLAWITAANEDFDGFFTELARGAPTPPRYRWKGIAYRFFRSVKRTTPSAYAVRWSVAYNVAGSLNISALAVRETLFHEVFHLDDAVHDEWSTRALRPIFDAIVKRCGTRIACLSPYAPNDTRVRGGTYYAFQPNNGDAVHEYAAELALRYYRENRAAMRGETLQHALFKCGPAENRQAWDAIRGEFFANVDRTPSCTP